MNTMKNQRGAALWSVSLMVIAFGFMGLMALKLIPVYMSNYTIKSIIESIEKSPDDFKSPTEVRTAILKRMSINNIDQVTYEDVFVALVDYNYEIDIDYEVRVPFVSNIDFCVTFANHGEFRAN